MTKLIAALAILAALAWAVTAAASWITRKKAPLALAAGRAPAHATAAEQDRAMVRAQWRTLAAIGFAAIMFAALLRISIGLSGQAGLPVAMTTGLSASGGMLLLSALPASKLPAAKLAAGDQPAGNQPATNQPAPAQAAGYGRSPLLPWRAFLLPAATLAAFTAFAVATELAPDIAAVQTGAVPLLLVAAALAGSSLVVLHRLAATAALPDPRMAALDRRWREISARNLLHFASGALLSCLGTAGIMAAASVNAAALNTAARAAGAPASPDWANACTAGGAAAAAAGVVLLVLAAKGTLTIRTRVREGAPAAITA